MKLPTPLREVASHHQLQLPVGETLEERPRSSSSSNYLITDTLFTDRGLRQSCCLTQGPYLAPPIRWILLATHITEPA